MECNMGGLKIFLWIFISNSIPIKLITNFHYFSGQVVFYKYIWIHIYISLNLYYPKFLALGLFRKSIRSESKIDINSICEWLQVKIVLFNFFVRLHLFSRERKQNRKSYSQKPASILAKSERDHAKKRECFQTGENVERRHSRGLLNNKPENETAQRKSIFPRVFIVRLKPYHVLCSFTGKEGHRVHKTRLLSW